MELGLQSELQQSRPPFIARPPAFSGMRRKQSDLQQPSMPFIPPTATEHTIYSPTNIDIDLDIALFK
jgi:hypothetical protein